MDLLKKSFIENWIKTFGNITQTCQITGISRRTYYDWMRDDAEFKAAIDASEPLEIKLDFIENKLVQRINEGSDAVLLMCARTLGKKRGYVEKTEQDINVKGGILVNFTPAPNCDPINDDTSQH